MVDMLVFAPAALTGAITCQLAPNDSPGDGDYRTFQHVPGTDWSIAAGKCVPLETGNAKSLRIVSGSAEGADRLFIIMTQLQGY